jgi:hypothetical protein
MATITKARAVELLTEAIEKAHPDDRVEIYNELFPEAPTTQDAMNANAHAIDARIGDHIRKGLEIEEVLDLWNVVFPDHHGGWFDEESGLFHYREGRQPVAQAE